MDQAGTLLDEAGRLGMALGTASALLRQALSTRRAGQPLPISACEAAEAVASLEGRVHALPKAYRRCARLAARLAHYYATDTR